MNHNHKENTVKILLNVSRKQNREPDDHWKAQEVKKKKD